MDEESVIKQVRVFSGLSGKKRLCLFVLFVLFLCTFFGVLGYFLGRNAIPFYDTFSSPTTSPTANVQNIDRLDETKLPSDWKVYTNENYKFSTMYPPELEVFGSERPEEPGQFSHLLQVDFGRAPLKNGGYYVQVDKTSPQLFIQDKYTGDLVGHETDQIDSIDYVESNGALWTKLNYQVTISTEIQNITLAFTAGHTYSYAVTSLSGSIDTIISGFKILTE